MKRQIILLALLIYSFDNFSQPTIQWQKTIGGSWYDDLISIQQTTDGGYILGGYSVSDASGDKSENKIGRQDFWIVKVNSAGAIQWENTIGGDSIDMFASLEQTADGGYILGGYSRSSISGDKTENCKGAHDYWVVKLNGAGNIQWQKTIGGSGEDELFSLRQTIDGGYILGGLSRSNISGDKTENSKGFDDYWIVKIDTIGSIQWQKTVGGNANDGIKCIHQTNDGGYILGGLSGSTISGDKTDTSRGGWDGWVVKMDSSGSIQWQKTIGGSNDDDITYIQQTNDGGYVIGGNSLSDISGDKTENNCTLGEADYWVIKLDSSGNIQWQNTIGGSGYDVLYYVQQTTSGGFILGGYSESDILCDKTENSRGGIDYWVVSLDTSGSIVWQMTIGGNDGDGLTSMQQTSDNGYILGGISDSNISGDKTENSKGVDDYWIIKLSAYVGIEDEDNFLSLNIYPNPVRGEFTVSSSGIKFEKIELYNLLGEKISEKTCASKCSEQKINAEYLSSGMYFVKVFTESASGGGVVTKKLLKQ